MRTILFLTLLLSAATVYASYTPDQAASFPDPDLVATSSDYAMRPLMVGVQPQVPGGVQLIAGETYIACGQTSSGAPDLRIAAEWAWNRNRGECSEIQDISAVK